MPQSLGVMMPQRHTETRFVRQPHELTPSVTTLSARAALRYRGPRPIKCVCISSFGGLPLTGGPEFSTVIDVFLKPPPPTNQALFTSSARPPRCRRTCLVLLLGTGPYYIHDPILLVACGY